MPNISIDTNVRRAIAQIKYDFGDDVSVVEKNKLLRKFGRQDNLGTTEETVWVTGGNETYATGNDINLAVSTNPADTQPIVIEGHTLSGSDLTFVVQTVTLTGTIPAVLPTPLFRATRLYNNGTTDFAGVVTVYEGGGPTHLTSLGNNSFKCATSLSQYDYWIITQMVVGVQRANTRSVDFSLQTRQFGKVFLTAFQLEANSSSGSVIWDLNPAMIVRPNSDVRVQAISSGTTTGVVATLNGHLASIRNF